MYPIIIRIVAAFYKTSENPFYEPTISILISAYNEEKVILKRIENIAGQKYDLSKIEVIVGSDNSSDRTNDILRELENKYNWLKVFIFTQRRGKASVLNDLVDVAQNEILIFTDANTIFDNIAIQKITKGFSSEQVGGVCGRLILRETNENKYASVEERRYWEYETFIKKAEGRCGILIGANGGIFAIRRSLFEEIPEDAVTDDLFITLSVLKNNYRFMYRDDAIASEEVTSTMATEFRRKVRFAATNIQTLLYFRRLLFNKNVLLSFAFWSHKIIRWFFPFILFAVFSLTFY